VVSRRRHAAEHYDITEAYLGGKRKLPLLKEEIWRNADGGVTRYSLAYIDPELFAGDNGRVLGYDNAHGLHHRHLRGQQTEYRFRGFERLLRQFEAEVRSLRRVK
jgi:hypothetical protein